MKMNFLVLSKLLNSSSSLLIAGYSFTFFSLWLLLTLQENSLLNLILCIILITLGLAHHYVSIRVNFDAQLLASIAEEIKDKNRYEETIDQLTKQLDDSLISLKLIPENKAARHWSLRFAGCQKLFKFQMTMFITQILLLVFILIYLFIKSN